MQGGRTFGHLQRPCTLKGAQPEKNLKDSPFRRSRRVDRRWKEPWVFLNTVA